MRVHELAKELGVGNKDLLAKLRDLGVTVSNHMSNVDDTAIEVMREEFNVSGPIEVVIDDDVEEEIKAKKIKKDKKPKEHVAEQPKAELPAPTEKIIRVRGTVTVKEFAEQLGIMPNKLIAELMGMKILATLTERLDLNVVRDIALKHGFEFEHEKKAVEHSHILHKQHDDQHVEEYVDRPEDLVPRPPVVTFLGHVDHGKTSLMDKIRDTSVVKGESGGITQHIGAYSVEVGGRMITFLDTPGHEAFNAMRARGANLTDIAVIVIAADDGIMPQTKEALKFARAAEVTLIVAINKMDLPSADSTKVKQQLQVEGLTPEDWGGELICCEVSAMTGKGIDNLLEMILLQADVLELRANPNRRAEGYVIEAQLESGKGPTAHMLVSNGTLKVGDFILCGSHCGKVKALISDQAVNLKSIGPGMPVKCMGLSGVPEAGAHFKVFANEKTARDLAEQTRQQMRHTDQSAGMKESSVEALFKQIKAERELELRVIIKADTQGSIEAIIESLRRIKSDKVNLNIIVSGTGTVTINDIKLAGSSGAKVFGFHAGKEPGIKMACKHEKVDFFMYEIIYELIDKVKDCMTDLLPPLIIEHVKGRAEVKQTFPVGKRETAAGCMVVSGSISSKNKVRVLRGETVMHDGTILSLKRFQNEAAVVKESQECGIRLTGFAAINVGDILEFYEQEEKRQAL